MTRLFIKDIEKLCKKKREAKTHSKHTTSSRERKGTDNSGNRDLINSSKSHPSEQDQYELSRVNPSGELESYSKHTSIKVARPQTDDPHFKFNPHKTPERRKGKQHSRLENILNQSASRHVNRVGTRTPLENYVSPSDRSARKIFTRYYSDFYLLKHRFGPSNFSKFCRMRDDLTARFHIVSAVFAAGLADYPQIRKEPQIHQILLRILAGDSVRVRLLRAGGLLLDKPASDQPPQQQALR